ncbi:MAG TPA: DUF2254 family protein [Dermatophilaceae bacterium]|jgi:uncharacterized membrane protein|nr:DUF2254 family protein [Dermatophilaceae bacterium]HMT89639.1 DUF2254 family protein [Dermatophilaceae bacterium]
MSVDYARPERPRAHAWERLWRPYWALPAIVAVGSAGLGLTLPRADERLAGWVPYVFESGPDGARQLLGTIASAMISVTGLVFSLTMVVLQLASSQFTPRLLGQFLQSRVVQLTLGVFVGSFLYALTVLRLIRGGDGTDFVPQVSVTLAFGYVLAAVAFFIAFIHHITQSIRLSHVLIDIGARTTASARRLYAGQRPSATWSPAPQTPRQGAGVPGGARRHHRAGLDGAGPVGGAAGLRGGPGIRPR